MSDDAIKRFVDVTGSSVEDAIKYLSICDNNVSLAVECFVDQQPHSNGSHNLDGEEEVRAPIPSRTDRIVEEHVRVGRIGKRPANAFSGERDFSMQPQFNSNSMARRKLKGLAELFKPPTDISFVGTLQSAKVRGKRLKKWLLVNLQDISDFKCQVLNRDLWSRPDVRNIIDQHFVFWQIYRDSLEGEHFMRFYNCFSSPFIGIIDPGTGELMKQWTLLTKDEFIGEVTMFLSEHFNTLNSPDQGPPAKRPCYNAARSALMDITESELSGSSSHHTNGTSHPHASSSHASSHASSSHASSSRASSSHESDISPPDTPPETPQTGTTIVKGEIISSTAAPEPAAPPIHPDKLNVTFRLPDGSRKSEAFAKECCCADLYTWLYCAGLSNHVIWTQFPKRLIPSDTTNIGSVVGCSRVMLYVEERDD